MNRHLKISTEIGHFGRLTQIAALLLVVNAGAALAEEPTASDRAIVGAAGGAVGAVTGAAAGAAIGYGIDKYKNRPAPLLKGTRTATTPLPSDPAEISREYKRDPRAFKQKYHGHREGWVIDENQAQQVDAARAEQDLEQKAKADRKIARKTTRKKARRKVSTVRPKRKTRPSKSVRRMQRNKVRLDKRGKTIQGLRTKIWELDGKPMKSGYAGDRRVSTKALPHIKNSTNAAKQHAKTAKRAKRGAEVAKKGAKYSRAAKGALAGGAAGMVAGAALGVKIPDAVDGVMFAGKLVSDSKNADKMIAKAAEDGVKMVGTAATTITNPAKMARNLGGAVSGVGKTLGLSGVFKRKGSVNTRVDSNGKCRTNSIWYRCRLQSARNGSGRASAGNRYTFGRSNRSSLNLRKGLSNGGRKIARLAGSTHRFATRSTKSVGRSFKKAGRSVGQAFKRPVRSVGRSLKKAGRSVGQAFKRPVRSVGRSFKKASRSVGRSFKRPVKSVGRSFKKAGRSIGRSFKRSTRSVKRSTRKVGRTIGRTARKAGRSLTRILSRRR